jgi:endonuclease/exonuclease/phosphatase family metal-dependent hydrolase
VGGGLKVSSFRRLLSHTSLDIIFLQETLVDSKKAIFFLNQFHSNWNTCLVNSLGTSGGLVVAWDPTKFDLSPFLCCGGIMLSGTCHFNNKRIHLLNIYRPCSDRQTFWNKVEARSLLDLENLIIVGDLNLTTSVREIWGDSSTHDSLVEFFISLFLTHNLVDYAPDYLAPTWHNGRLGSDSISKRLYHFLISNHLITTEDRICTWVDSSFLSDHAPIFLHLDSSTHKIAHPFKFNSG